jgi:splicing factor U2AF subunit
MTGQYALLPARGPSADCHPIPAGQFPAPGPNRQPIPAMFGNPGFPGDGTMSSFAGPMAGIGNPMRQSKRLYVGNVQLTCNEQNLADFFNSKMAEQRFSAGPAGDPVVAVQLNHEKSYAFIEVSRWPTSSQKRSLLMSSNQFRTPEEATAAMAFDGIIFQGIPLKIRRPKDYMGPEGPPGSIHIPGVVSTTVQDSPNKIYIGGLPTYLGDEQVMELLKSFGELKSFNLVKEGAGQTGASKVRVPFLSTTT